MRQIKYLTKSHKKNCDFYIAAYYLWSAERTDLIKQIGADKKNIIWSFGYEIHLVVTVWVCVG